jgi:hypothetical protein
VASKADPTLLGAVAKLLKPGAKAVLQLHGGSEVITKHQQHNSSSRLTICCGSPCCCLFSCMHAGRRQQCNAIKWLCRLPSQQLWRCDLCESQAITAITQPATARRALACILS